MSALFQGYCAADGRVQLSSAAATENFHRGMNTLFETGAVRIRSAIGGVTAAFRNGLAIDASGALILSSTNAIVATAPGGVAVDDLGRVCYTAIDPPDVIHQGVGLMNDGRLTVIGA